MKNFPYAQKSETIFTFCKALFFSSFVLYQAWLISILHRRKGTLRQNPVLYLFFIGAKK